MFINYHKYLNLIKKKWLVTSPTEIFIINILPNIDLLHGYKKFHKKKL